jgi:hypothetical protein
MSCRHRGQDAGKDPGKDADGEQNCFPECFSSRVKTNGRQHERPLCLWANAITCGQLTLAAKCVMFFPLQLTGTTQQLALQKRQRQSI